MSNSNQLIIAITGRNECPHLPIVLKSWLTDGFPVIFFDSGSTDGTTAVVREAGVPVIALQPPFSTPRARRAAVEYVHQQHPDVCYILIMDGDCALTAGWAANALDFIEQHPEVAAVNGHRTEADPHATSFNRIMNIEWDFPRGYVDTVLCDALYRMSAIRAVGNFDGSMIAGDEPELGHRLRLGGWQIYASPEHMSTHYGHLTSLRQWWTRNLRSGYVYIHIATLHANSSRRLWLREVLSNFLWGGLLPLAILLLLIPSRGKSLLLGLAYGVLLLRVYWRTRQRGYDAQDASLYALSVIAGKAPMLLGQLRYFLKPVISVVGTGMDYKR